MMSAEEQLFEQLRRAREQNELEDYRADDIISSVKQQELKYEQLSKQLEQERQTLAHQLQQVELGSETASLNSISESDIGSGTGSFAQANNPNHTFQYRAHVKVDDYSDTESRASTALPPINSSHIIPQHLQLQQPFSSTTTTTTTHHISIQHQQGSFPSQHNQATRPYQHSDTPSPYLTQGQQPLTPVSESNEGAGTSRERSGSGDASIGGGSWNRLGSVGSVSAASGSKSNTPLSVRRNSGQSGRGPQYNFGSVPAEKRVDLSLDEQQQQQQQPPIEEVAPTIEEDMRVAREPMDMRYPYPGSSNSLNSSKRGGGRDDTNLRRAPERPQLPAMYSNGMPVGGSGNGFMNGRDYTDSPRLSENNVYYNDEDPITFEQRSPSLEMGPPDAQGQNFDRLHNNYPNYSPRTPNNQYSNGATPIGRGTPQNASNMGGQMRSSDQDSGFEGQLTPRQQINNLSQDPRFYRSPGAHSQFSQQPRQQPTDSDSVKGSVSSRQFSNGGATGGSLSHLSGPSESASKRQPLGSQQALNDNSSNRVPLSSRQNNGSTRSLNSNNIAAMQVQTYPHQNSYHNGGYAGAPNHPGTLMIDASSPQPQFGNRMSPMESMGQHSPSVHSRSQYPPPGSGYPPPVNASGAPMVFDLGENTHGRDQRWRNPTLIEILDYLDHEDPRIVLNATGYLQHLTFEDQAMKVKTRENNGVVIIARMLEESSPELKKNLLGILRNMSFGKGTIENKLAIQRHGCIPIIVRILRTSKDHEIQELCCAVLWNISSEPDVKPEIVSEALQVLVDRAVVPESHWLEYENEHNTYLGSDSATLPSKPSTPASPHTSMPPEWSMLFRNATGCLRNLSADRMDYRQTMRQTRHLIDALIHVLNLSILKNEVSGRAVENCICIIRNLTFHLASEMERAGDPRYESAFGSHPSSRHNSSRSLSNSRNSARKNDDKVTPGCGPKKGKKGGNLDEQYRQSEFPSSDPYARGVELLWQPMMANVCIALLRESSNPDTLEAAAGTLQNMCAGAQPWCPRLRFAIRKRLGLPLLRELLATFENDFVIAAVAGALKNICIDYENKRLIGLHCTPELIKHLPSDIEREMQDVYCEKVAFILLCLKELCRASEDNCRYVHKADGLYRIIPLAKYRDSTSSASSSAAPNGQASSGTSGPPLVPQRIVKIAEELLVNMWNVKEMRREYKESGFTKAHFDPRAIVAVRKKYEPTTATTLRKNRAKSADDLNSSYGGTRSRHGTANRAGTANRHGGSTNVLAGTAGRRDHDQSSYSGHNYSGGREGTTPVSPAPHSMHSGEMGLSGGGGGGGNSYMVEYNNVAGAQRYSGDNADGYMQNEYRPQDVVDSPMAIRGLDPFQLQQQNMHPNSVPSPINSGSYHQQQPPDSNNTSQIAPTTHLHPQPHLSSNTHSRQNSNQLSTSGYPQVTPHSQHPHASSPLVNNVQSAQPGNDFHIYSSLDKQGRHDTSMMGGYRQQQQQQQQQPYYHHQQSSASSSAQQHHLNPQQGVDIDTHSWV
ncbi:uncharacterized protein LOC142353233 isoform X2 [Convolutriloba macropyga]|uniref:uncharacterized protein LOC142353233 isoform X2 n=1 Tax=Convolutriloba macropyga TaxID=536237 RepID=UPI003F524EC0